MDRARRRAARRAFRRASREERIARLFEGGESECQDFSDDEDIYFRSVRVEEYGETMNEEQPESETERVVDQTIETEEMMQMLNLQDMEATGIRL